MFLAVSLIWSSSSSAIITHAGAFVKYVIILWMMSGKGS